jgi:imidazolonepropionase-like amidohydrolase
VRRPSAPTALAFLAVLAPAALSAQGLTPAVPPPARGPVAITGVTVIDVASGRRLPAQTVVVRGTRLAAVGPAARVRVPSGARVVDGRGKFLIPGLWDMHVHFMNTGVTALPLLVANGVTGVREMGGYLDSTRAWRARMAAGELVGPRIRSAGPVLESPRYIARVRERDRLAGGSLAPLLLPYRVALTDSAGAERAVDSLARLGVDFIKFRNTDTRGAYYGMLAAAKRRGLTVAGHPPPPGVASLAEASDAGQRSVEHLVLPPLDDRPAAERAALYARFARNGTWYTPTLSVSVLAQGLADSAVRAALDDTLAGAAASRRRYAAPSHVRWGRVQRDERAPDTTTPRRNAILRRAYASGLADVRGMRRAGVRLLAGTDAGAVGVYPGFSLHEELALLVRDAGLTPREALWSATAGPARYFGLEREMGAIAAGMAADLVLLDRDPLADIGNTTSIRAVVADGRLLDRAALDALLATTPSRR